jgi:alpha-ketoglutarate-dependent taurine dioxygenase
MIEVRRLGPQVGAEITGVDVKALDEETFDAIYRAWLDCNVAVVREQQLAIGDYLAYSRRFGRIDPHPSKITRHPDVPEITLLGANKIGADGKLDMNVYKRGSHGWHTDGSYNEHPFKATQPYALAIPSRGVTPCSPACMPRTTRCPGPSGNASKASRARMSTAAAARRRNCSQQKTATGNRCFTPSSAPTPKPGAGLFISIPTR